MPHKMEKADRVRVTAMLAAATEALAFSVGRDRASLDSDPMYRRALVNCLQEIGEAAVGVTTATRDVATDVPWKQIVGMRNRLVHVYFAINLDTVWEVVDRDLPPLVVALERVIATNG